MPQLRAVDFDRATSSTSPPQWLMIVASVATSVLLLAPRRSAAGPIFFIMSEGMIMLVPVDLGVQDSLDRDLFGRNSSEESGLEDGDVDEMEEVEEEGIGWKKE